MNRVLWSLTGCVLLTGCAAVAPFASLLSGPSAPPPLQIQTQTGVTLAKNNYVLIKTNVVGHSRGFSLLGFITIVPATLTKAMNQFYAEAELQSGQSQTPAHLVIEHSSSYFVLFGIPAVDVRADIVEFRPEPFTPPPAGPPGQPARPAPP